MKTALLLIAAIVLTIDSVLRAFRSNFNLGSLIMYCITAALWCYALFHAQIDAFCAYGVGLFFKWLLMAGCVFVLGILVFITTKGHSSPADGTEASVIVLGAGLRGKQVSGLLARRLNAAYDYYATHTDVMLVVTGGQGAQEEIPEAEAMHAYLVAKGVPSEKIIVEAKSVSTEENFLFAKQLLAQHGIDASQPMAFATNAFHCYRSEQYAKKAGFTNANAIPASIGFSSIMPCYLREVLAVVHYWVFQS